MGAWVRACVRGCVGVSVCDCVCGVGVGVGGCVSIWAQGAITMTRFL